MKNWLFIFLLCLCGCITQKTVTVNKAVLLPEDRVFTLPANQQINVTLDGKAMSMVFPSDMKVVSPSFLIRQEETLNQKTFEKIKAEKKSNNLWGAIGGLITLGGGIITLILKNKPKENK